MAVKPEMLPAASAEENRQRGETIQRIAADIAPDMDRKINDWLASDMHWGSVEQRRLAQFLWDNKIGTLRCLQALAAPAWQPIETAPKDGTYVLLLVQDIYGAQDPGGPRRKPVLSYWRKPEDERPIVRGAAEWTLVGTHWKPTHWLPFPAPPTEGQG